MTARQQTPDIMGNILAAKPEPATQPKPVYVKTTSIRRDGGMQPRGSLNWDYVKELMAAIEDGAKLPPVDVTYDGQEYWLWDGYHRWQAHNDLGLLDIAATLHQGDQATAQWESYGTNQTHGLRRSNDDKERAARAALRHPKAAALSNREIARHLGVDEKTIRKYREDMTATAEIPQSTNRIGADGRTINTANIGAKAQPAVQDTPVWKLENVVREVWRVVAGDYNAARMDPELVIRTANQSKNEIDSRGPFWMRCQKAADESFSNGAYRYWRFSDMKSAINNVAEQMTQAALEKRRVAISTLAEPETPAPGDGKLLIDWTDEDWATWKFSQVQSTPAAPEPDPWRVAYNTPGSRQSSVERVGRALVPWLREYRDEYGRTWQEIAERGNVAHTNSTLWQDIQKEQQRRGLDMSESILKDAIKQAFNWLAADRKLAGIQATPDLQPVIVVDGDRPLPDWVTTPDDSEAAALPAPVPVSQRDDYDGDEWYTPAEYIEAARLVMGSIDLDVASSELAQSVVKADCYFTKADNGLAMARWIRDRIWLNPPYSSPTPWIEKLIAEHQAGPFCTQAIVLVNNATETAWFQALLERYPVCLPAKRLAFWRHDHSGVTARQGQAFFYLGPNVDKFVEVFSQFGPVLRRMA
jgi:phage N-6-adenine-methyltransferase